MKPWFLLHRIIVTVDMNVILKYILENRNIIIYDSVGKSLPLKSNGDNEFPKSIINTCCS